MIFELATLPPIFQQYMQEHPAVELKLVDGKLIATPTRTERPFNFDIDELDSALNSGVVPVPKFDNAEQLADWLGRAK